MHKAAGEDVFYEMEEALIKRILPHSIEAEQSVIGSMILDRDAILVASEILTSDDFYQSQYGIIFDAMVELCNEGKPVDLITLQNRLKEKELPPDISSMEYVRDLISAVPTSANVKYYANIVSEKAVLRRLIKVNEEVENACYMEKEGTQMILEEAEKKLFNVLQRRSSDEFRAYPAGGFECGEQYRESLQDEGNGNWYSYRFRGSGLQDLRNACFRPGADRGPSVYGKNCFRS